MKNKKLRNALIALSVAVACGVLVLGVGVAVGDAPGYNPPGSGVSPVFSGLTVNGTVSATDLNISGSVTGGDLNVNSVVTSGNISAGNDLNAGRDLNVDGDSTISGLLQLDGSINNPGFSCTVLGCTYFPVTIDDSLLATGNITTQATGDFGMVDTEYIHNLAGSGGDPLKVDDDLYVGQDLDVGRDLRVVGDISVSPGSTIGRFYSKSKSVYASATSISCDTGHSLTGCGASATYGGTLTYLFPSGNRCYAGQNTTGTFYAYALCFDPDGVL